MGEGTGAGEGEGTVVGEGEGTGAGEGEGTGVGIGEGTVTGAGVGTAGGMLVSPVASEHFATYKQYSEINVYLHKLIGPPQVILLLQ